MTLGESVKGYEGPLLNEREIRAAAGLLFLATFISWVYVAFRNNFLPIKYVISFFLADLVIRVAVQPKYSPSLIIGRMIVRSQTPEFVDAKPKKFAWMFGIFLSVIMFCLTVLFNSFSIITSSICFICLTFLFFEAAFGICLGCLFYPLFFGKRERLCAGEICAPRSKQPIQTVSGLQISIVLSFILIFILVIVLF